MLHHGTTEILLEGVVRWLGTEISQNDAEWQAHTDLVQSCVAEMLEITELTVSPSKGGTSRHVHRPVVDKVNRAMPHVRSMLTAMREHDRTTALAHGETTLQWLCPGTQAGLVFRSRKIIITEAMNHPSAN